MEQERVSELSVSLRGRRYDQQVRSRLERATARAGRLEPTHLLGVEMARGVGDVAIERGRRIPWRELESNRSCRIPLTAALRIDRVDPLEQRVSLGESIRSFGELCALEQQIGQRPADVRALTIDPECSFECRGGATVGLVRLARLLEREGPRLLSLLALQVLESCKGVSLKRPNALRRVPCLAKRALGDRELPVHLRACLDIGLEAHAHNKERRHKQRDVRDDALPTVGLSGSF
jgi:hypothetical protein